MCKHFTILRSQRQNGPSHISGGKCHVGSGQQSACAGVLRRHEGSGAAHLLGKSHPHGIGALGSGRRASGFDHRMGEVILTPLEATSSRPGQADAEDDAQQQGDQRHDD